jgi:hypothetical protein
VVRVQDSLALPGRVAVIGPAAAVVYLDAAGARTVVQGLAAWLAETGDGEGDGR